MVRAHRRHRRPHRRQPTRPRPHFLDPDLVNPQGGGIALGHPLGCSSARLLTTLAWRLHRDGRGIGLATMCIGVGQGIAVVLVGC
jgi:acetyl-CoA acetyltransferase